MGEHAVLLAPPIDTGLDEPLRLLPGAEPRQEREAARPRESVQAGFEDFFRSQYPTLLRALYLVTGSRHEAEELAQDTFVRAYERWELVSNADNRPGYLYRMALNLYRSKLRRMARAARKVVRPAAEPDPIEALDQRDAIGRALTALSCGQRDAVVLVEWVGLSHEEAGQALGISPITVRVRIHRARAVLRPLLERGDG